MAAQTQARRVNLNIRVYPGEKSKFRNACKRTGHKQSDVVRKLMRLYASGKITFTETTEIS